MGLQWCRPVGPHTTLVGEGGAGILHSLLHAIKGLSLSIYICDKGFISINIYIYILLFDYLFSDTPADNINIDY